MSYSAAIAKLLDIAQAQRSSRWDCHECVPLAHATGRITAHDITSPRSIPEYDTSAMDGFAIHWEATASASPQRPAVFRVQGSIAAGDDPAVHEFRAEDYDEQLEPPPCVEIMTGAIFPDGLWLGKPYYNACAKIEDTIAVAKSPANRPGRYILITKPIAPNANKRFAWGDIAKGDTIMKSGEIVRPSHILSLASVGLESITVVREPLVAVSSTGKELANGKGATGDANGPYLTGAIRDVGVKAEFLGILDDNPAGLRRALYGLADSGQYDAVLTSGGVSKGKWDFVRDVLDQIDAEIVFHGLAIRPGHPVLFALIPTKEGKLPFFGLPGNPGASAACFRFLVVPYLRALQGRPIERPIPARLKQPKGGLKIKQDGNSLFHHGTLHTTAAGHLVIEVSHEQGPSKVGPFITANCWIHLKGGAMGYHDGEIVDCYPLCATTEIQLMSP